MRLVVDSHVALWWLAGDQSLGVDCRTSLESAAEVYFSPVTPWELGIKRALGKLSFPDGLAEALAAGGFIELPITAAHAERAASLPAHHGDPLDRMLVAQAQIEALVLVTADRSLNAYDVDLLDARA